MLVVFFLFSDFSNLKSKYSLKEINLRDLPSLSKGDKYAESSGARS